MGRGPFGLVLESNIMLSIDVGKCQFMFHVKQSAAPAARWRCALRAGAAGGMMNEGGRA
jgi:hypothetical protein